MDDCARRGIGLVLAGAFNSGILAGGGQYNYRAAPEDITARVAALRSACSEAGGEPAGRGAPVPPRAPAALSVVVGAHDAAQVRTNVAWFEESIPPGFWGGLKARGLIAEAVPVPA